MNFGEVELDQLLAEPIQADQLLADKSEVIRVRQVIIFGRMVCITIPRAARPKT